MLGASCMEGASGQAHTKSTGKLGMSCTGYVVPVDLFVRASKPSMTRWTLGLGGFSALASRIKRYVSRAGNTDPNDKCRDTCLHHMTGERSTPHGAPRRQGAPSVNHTSKCTQCEPHLTVHPSVNYTWRCTQCEPHLTVHPE